jgi:hypothetical protein
MGDWSDAMEDGVICRGCAMPLGGTGAGLCPDCSERQAREGCDQLGPKWIPDNSKDRTPRR